MKMKKVIAIVSEVQLDNIEAALMQHGVSGFTLHPVRGRGNYCNTYSRDSLVSHVQIEIYTAAAHASKIAHLIMKVADVGANSEGLVAIESLDELYWVHQQLPAAEVDFNFIDQDDASANSEGDENGY